MNIYDIAKEAGVSISTVSRVLNEKQNVSRGTRERVLTVLRERGYQPSAVARGLATGSMKTVAILDEDVRIPHRATTSFIMEQQLSRMGYLVILCNTGEDIADWERYLKALYERKIDGMILTGSVYCQLDGDDSLGLFDNIPIVMANGKIDRPNIYSVLVDDTYGMGLATEHLYKRGHKNLAYIMDRQHNSGCRKRDGFIKKMKELGYEDAEKRVFPIPYSMEEGYRIGQQLYRDGYDGLVFGDDYPAAGAVHGLADLGVRIPEEVAITGCNNCDHATVCRPQLTSVNNKAELLSELTVRLLVDLMNHKEEVADLVIIPELTVRKTS